MLGANAIYGFPPIPGGALGGGIGGALGAGFGYLVGRAFLGQAPEKASVDINKHEELPVGSGNLSTKQVVGVCLVFLFLGLAVGIGALLLGY